MNIQIFQRQVEKRDFDLIWYWFSKPIIPKLNIHKISKNNFIKMLDSLKKRKKLFVIISDNIRIGIFLNILSQKYYFFSTHSFFFKYINKKYLLHKNIIPKNFNYKKILNFNAINKSTYNQKKY